MEGDDASEVQSIEATGKNVDEAIEKGLGELDLVRSDVSAGVRR